MQTMHRMQDARFELRQVHRQLRKYASEHEGRLPDSLDVVTTAPQLQEHGIVYFPAPGKRLADLGEDVILAIASQPFYVPLGWEDQRHRVPLLMGSGEVRISTSMSFPKTWARSNAARQAIGASPVAPDQLGPVAAWLHPQTQPNE